MWEGRSPSCYGPAYPAGLEFIAVFFGCLYAGVIAVPGIVPSITKPSRYAPRAAVRGPADRAVIAVGCMLDRS
jgi:acyl-CoA synthetase (AMP-forming)/AMP-acid ligase II